MIGDIYFEMSDYDPVLISMGMRMIFPSLRKFITGYFSTSTMWDRLDLLVEVFRLAGIADLTEKLMMCLSVARESPENVPVRSAVRPRLTFGFIASVSGSVCLLISPFVSAGGNSAYLLRATLSKTPTGSSVRRLV